MLLKLKPIIMADTLYVRIKKNYAADVIKDLQKMDAIELLEEAPVPEWQKKEVRKRLKDLQKNLRKNIKGNTCMKKARSLKRGGLFLFVIHGNFRRS